MKEYRENKSEVYQVFLVIKVIILVIIALDFEEIGWFLAHLVMSLYNHALLCGVVSIAVYSSPSDRFDHRNFISCKYMYLHPQYKHMKYYVNIIYIFKWQPF